MAEMRPELNATSLQSELDRLQEEHRALDAQLEGFNQRAFLTQAEQVERTQLKKLKLHAKDRMLQVHRLLATLADAS